MKKKKLKFTKFNSLENMTVNIVAEGQLEVWHSIDLEKNPFKRCELRKLFWLALNKMGRAK